MTKKILDKLNEQGEACFGFTMMRKGRIKFGNYQNRIRVVLADKQITNDGRHRHDCLSMESQ